MHTPFSRDLRAYVSLSVSVTAGIAILDPTSQHREALEGGASFLTPSGSTFKTVVTRLGNPFVAY